MCACAVLHASTDGERQTRVGIGNAKRPTICYSVSVLKAECSIRCLTRPDVLTFGAGLAQIAFRVHSMRLRGKCLTQQFRDKSSLEIRIGQQGTQSLLERSRFDFRILLRGSGIHLQKVSYREV